MRTIKFRGKDFAGAWWYGYPSLYEDNPVIHPLQCVGASMLVDEDTVGQFTGLFDEDQHDIYEGDIIKIVEEFDDENVYTRIGVVCFEEGMYELQDKNGKHFAYLGWLMHDDAITKLEVIGNIHDNPELLKGGKR